MQTTHEAPDDALKRKRSDENQIIRSACEVLERRLVWNDDDAVVINSTRTAARYLWLKLAERTREVFAVMLLNSSGTLIEYRELFQGTVDRSSVFPREIARIALLRNAASVIVAHNHPSGDSTPSDEDVAVTRRIHAALRLVDVRLLDHIVIGKRFHSLAKHGLMPESTSDPRSGAAEEESP